MGSIPQNYFNVVHLRMPSITCFLNFSFRYAKKHRDAFWININLNLFRSKANMALEIFLVSTGDST
jgi:hypothetical protein